MTAPATTCAAVPRAGLCLPALVLAIALPAAGQTGQRPLSPISSGTSTRVFRRTSRILERMLIGPAIGAAYGGLRPARRPGAIAVAPVVTLHGCALAASVRFQGFER
jgi:hypothetical protein